MQVVEWRLVINESLRSADAAVLAAFAPNQSLSLSIDLPLATKHTSELIDITEQVREIVAGSGIETGITLISSPHTTCAVIVNESEPGFTADLLRALERIAPVDAEYDHNAAPHDLEDEAPNGYAHVRAAVLSSPSVLLPVRDGDISLGRWQRLFFVELDRARARRVQITLLGHPA